MTSSSSVKVCKTAIGENASLWASVTLSGTSASKVGLMVLASATPPVRTRAPAATAS
ncbi:unannotated protein [freshwater metagenome]|uniref:Unannotated protein n=1 Tax=freshwater metagenome TaxID=449393 RepID=A0A6J7PFD6_9ZZZZ